MALPRDIVEHAIFERHTKARNAAQLEQMIFKALPRAYPGTREGLSRLSVKDAIQLSVRVAENALSYCDVDNDTTFVRKYGADLPIEEYMGLGQGECNRYASVAYETFNFQNGAQKLEAD